MFLGVDGGGTKTAFCLVTSDGEVVGRAELASAYAPGEPDILEGVLREGVKEVCRQATVDTDDIHYAFLGVPGYGESRAELPLVDAVPRRVLGSVPYACDNDMVCGWAGSLALADGINVISGTGSMSYGERAGRRARAGGWGELFGDEGSAHWIAVRGLSVFSRMSDGRQPCGPLHELLRSHLRAEVDLDVLDLVLNRWRGDRGRVASLCPVVVDAAERGDAAARQIVEDAASELVLLVDGARTRLGFPPDEPVRVSYSGGVFAATLVREAFGRGLAAAPQGYVLQQPVYPPVIGAALYAAKEAGAPLGAAALERLLA